MTTTKSIINEYWATDVLFHELTDQQLTQLIGQWLQDNCPGVPGDAADYFNDALVSAEGLMENVTATMAGAPADWTTAQMIMQKAIRKECSDHLQEYWGFVFDQLNQEAA